jgi:arsenate reductase (thioredoxin)
MEPKEKLTILFLCTGNSCRSQMAEAWARHIKGDVVEAYSAGTVPKGVDQRAVKAMSHYRRIRDEIKAYVETLPESLNP